jgi:5-hydroxyisourate hydrolase
VQVADIDLQVAHGPGGYVPQPGSDSRPTISTHVLDTGSGQPAAGVPVTLSKLGEDGHPIRMTQALTDADGRVKDLLERPLTAGTFRLEVTLGAREGFFDRFAVDVRVEDVERSYHVPFLVAPFSVTSYRGS